MKLLVYSHFFAPSIGGVENAVQYLSEGLHRLLTFRGDREFDVTVVTQTEAGTFDDNSFPFRVLRKPSLKQLWRAIRESHLVHIAGPSLAPLVLSFLAQRPVVIEHHGYQAVCPNGVLVHQPDNSVCPGHFQARYYLECLRCQNSQLSFLRACTSLLFMFPRHLLARKVAANLAISRRVMEIHSLPRTSVIYYGINDPLDAGIVSSPPPAKLCFAYVGRLVPEKGLPILLQAVAILRQEGHEFELRLIGDGSQRTELEALVGKLGLASRVRITGYLSGSNLAEALRDVRVVVMPSIWEETAGLAAIEQMMRGRLVIASKIGGLAEVIGDTGLTFPAGNTQALADTMKSVLQNPAIIDALGAKARDRALRLFSRERMIEEHARMYRNLFESQHDSSDSHA